MSKPTAVVFDIDGVLADVRHRLHHLESKPRDWAGFFGAALGDPVLPEGLRAVEEAVAAGHAPIYVTGRPESCRMDTLAWFRQHGITEGELHMRGASDRQPGRLTKLESVRRLEEAWDVVEFVDDDASVVEHLRHNGYQVRHATWMDRTTDGVDVAPLLTEVQQDEGRT